ncbi:MAG: SWIM zinc finger family protein [Archaeoglobaceae archaeon]|nr:SWIM zinc finger family protein [Archaeoglobaceae archaeon]
MIFNTVPDMYKVNLQRVSFCSRNESFNRKVLLRLQRACELPRPKRLISTPGSDQYIIKGSSGVYYEVVLGKKEKRAYCTCPDFQRNMKIAEEKGYESVVPCKHILKILAYRRATRK